MGMLDRLYNNRVTEKELRQWLDRNHYYGASARFEELELHALKRPGWEQVFRFALEAKNSGGQWVKLFGCMRTDQRYSTEIQVHENQIQQRLQIARWSEGMLKLRTKQRTDANGNLTTDPAPHTWRDLGLFASILIVVMLGLAFALQAQEESASREVSSQNVSNDKR